MITEQGEAADELFLVLDGVVRVEVDGERLAEYGPGSLHGERAVLEGGRRTSTVRAVTDCKLALATADQVDRGCARATLSSRAPPRRSNAEVTTSTATVARDRSERGIPGTTVSVFLADDNLIVREGVRALLSLEQDMTVVGTAADYDELVTGPASSRPRSW